MLSLSFLLPCVSLVKQPLHKPLSEYLNENMSSLARSGLGLVACHKALAELHKANFQHGDTKIANMVLGLDFGMDGNVNLTGKGHLIDMESSRELDPQNL